MIFANHAHVFPAEIKPEGTVEKLLALMENCGIDRAVCFAPFADRFSETSLPGEPNGWLASEIAHRPEFTGFGTIDFDAPDLSGQVERIKQLGFKGIKMHPPYQEFDIDSPEAFEVYEQAQEEGLFISFHCGMHWHRLRGNLPVLYDEVAWNFPRLRFSLEHIGGSHFFNDALAVMCNNSRAGVQPRVFAGWTSVSDREGPGAWALTDRQLETVIFQTGEERSIFGIDFPYNDEEYIRADIERIRGLDITDKAKENILGVTLERVLDFQMSDVG
ncbi:MAG: amidohydrolase family protein [Clostridia bacterium]|nr:amidohydrolase family protein [Clostridia bacterium]